jgi:ATP-binding cassette subfamily B protein
MIEFIEGLPSGLATQLGERGASLSGGQRQKLAIARALYRQPEILILDEATSALDSASENHIQRTIAHLQQQGKTIIVIAHRLSTVMRADKICVLEKGELVEEGSHTALMQREGKYYNFWAQQMPGEKSLIS